MRYFFIIFLLGIGNVLSAQEIANFNISQQDGLPSNTVFDIFQDSKGFLWVATENGLARYNGSEFRFVSNSQIRSLAVSYLSEDEKGRIWLHNFYGELLFVENDSLKKLDSWEKFYESGFPGITNLGDRLLLNSPASIFLYEIEDKKWARLDSLFKNVQPDSHAIVNYAHHLEHDGEVWIIFSKGENVHIRSLFDSEKHYTIDYSNFNLSANILRMTFFNGKIWVHDRINNLLFELFEGDVKDISEKYKERLNNARQIKNLGNGMMAFFGSSGCYLLNENDNGWLILDDTRNVSSVATDKEGGYWVGTLNEGVFYFPSLGTELVKKSKNDMLIKLAVDNKYKKVISGAYDGSIATYSFNGELLRKIENPNSIEIQSLFIDEETERLIYCGSSLIVRDLQNLNLTKNKGVTSVKDIVKINNNYGLATSGGLYFLDSIAENDVSILGNQRCSSLGYDSVNQIIWVGTQKGLKEVDLNNMKSMLWRPTQKGLSPGVSKIYKHQELFFMGTFTDGLMILEGKKIIDHITMANGLPSNHITALASKGNLLYIGTDRGIAVYSVKEKTIDLIDDTKGLTSNEIYDLVTVDNKLWVCSPNGLQIFNSFSVKNTQKPIIHINKISAGELKFTDSQKEITLPSSTSELVIDFDVSNNLKSRGKTVIKYRIKGLKEENWSTTTLKYPSAKYQSLPLGKWTFEAIAINEDGVQSANAISIPFKLLAPFWKRPQFFFVIFIFILIIALVIVYNRFSQINERNKQILLRKSHEQNLRIAQLTSIRAQMNPHFIFNTMSMIQGKVLNGLSEQANSAIQDFSLLMRKVLDFSSKETVALTDEIEVLEKYLFIEKERFSEKLSYEIKVDKRLKEEGIRMPSLFTQPYVENALRHGLLHKEGKKELLIIFRLLNDDLVIEIDDNGIGRKASFEINKSRHKSHSSFAMEAYSKRIELLNVDRSNKIELEIIDKYNVKGLATGTKVVIKIPLINEPVKIS